MGAQGYIGRAPGDSSVIVARQTFTPTGITTNFTFASGYTVGYVDAYLNGARLIEGSDYTATDGSVVGLTTHAQNGDVLELVVYKAFNVANVTAATADFSVGGDLSVTGTSALTGNATVGSAITMYASAGIVSATQFFADGVLINPGAGGTWANYDTNTGVSTTKKVKIENNLEVTGAASTFSGNLTVGGVLTYDDVTNVDSIGIITARSHVSIADSILHTGDTDTSIRFPAADTFTVETGGTERIRVGSAGSVSISPIDGSSIATLSAAGGNTDLRLRAVGTGGWFEVETNSASRLRISSAGLVGVGTINPGGLLTVYGDPAEVRLQHDGNGSYSRLISDSNNQFNIYTGGGPNLAMVIDQNQDVGIGTNNPGTKLDVRGGDWANGDIVVGEKDNAGRIKFARGADGSDSGSIGFAAADSNSVLSMNVASGDGTLTFQTNSTERVRITSTGLVGIGTDSPLDLLHITSASGDARVVIQGTVNNDSELKFYEGGTNKFTIGHDAATGEFRIGSVNVDTSIKLKINAAGDATFSGVATASQFDATSDVALKENIEVIDEPIVKLSELKGVTFDWKAGGHSVGVIAQDVEKVLPTAVGGSEDRKTVNYNAIIGLLVESVKDQQKQIEELKSLLDK